MSIINCIILYYYTVSYTIQGLKPQKIYTAIAKIKRDHFKFLLAFSFAQT